MKFDPKQTGNGFVGPLGPTTAELTPRYQAALEEKLRQVAAGNEWDQFSDCLPAGYPRWFAEPFLTRVHCHTERDLVDQRATKRSPSHLHR